MYASARAAGAAWGPALVAVSEDSGRPQDAGRPHRRKREIQDPAELALLERYRQAMRDELGDLLVELRGRDPVQLGADGEERRIRPKLEERSKGWDLAIKLGRELAAAGWDPPGPPAPAPSSRGTGPAPRLSARERRALGGS